jgi:hypothetical protein
MVLIFSVIPRSEATRAPSAFADVSLRTAAERDKRRRRDGAHLSLDEEEIPRSARDDSGSTEVFKCPAK